LFCAILWEHARKDPEFGNWLLHASGLKLTPAVEWELGFEVCFYRDHLWHLGRSAHAEGYLKKRTFDLCLFSENSVVIIEAKVCEAFKPKQNLDFAKDRDSIRRLFQRPNLQVDTVALASSRYFRNAERHGRAATLQCFDGRLSWLQLAERYRDPLLVQADKMYKQRKGAFLNPSISAHGQKP